MWGEGRCGNVYKNELYIISTMVVARPCNQLGLELRMPTKYYPNVKWSSLRGPTMYDVYEMDR